MSENQYVCRNCGAPTTSEICPYCGAVTQMNTNMANADYPVMKCKSVDFNFIRIGFPLIFGISFLIIPLMCVIMFSSISKASGAPDFLSIIPIIITIPFFMISFVSIGIGLNFIYKNRLVKTKGYDTTALVYGYIAGGGYINGQPVQQVKLLVNTEEGPKFILYNTMKTIKQYKVNSSIKIKMYNDLFLING